MKLVQIVKLDTMLLAATFIVYILLIFWGLGQNHLTNWDEAWYADISRSMATTGNIMTPVWNTRSFYDKPPLYLWFSAVSLKIFGISEFSQRFFSSLSAVGVFIVLYLLSKQITNKSIAMITMFIFSSTIGFLYRARTGNLDVFLSFWILLSIYSFYKAFSGKMWWFIIMGVAVGLGFLTKGFVAFLFPAIAMVYLFLKKTDHAIIKWFIKGIIVAVIISGGWFGASFLINGKEFVSTFLSHQTEKLLDKTFFWDNFSFDYILYLKSGIKFWVFFLVPALMYVLFSWKNQAKIIIMYLLIFYITLMFSKNKSNWFLIPLYPLFSLVIAQGIYSSWGKISQTKDHILFVIIALFSLMQNVIYAKEFIVPDIAGDEARVALEAKRRTGKNEVLYLTNYYYPTTVFYSQRKTYAVYSDQHSNASWWIKGKDEWGNILRRSNVFIIATREELNDLQAHFPKEVFEVLYKSGDKMLVKKV